MKTKTLIKLIIAILITSLMFLIASGILNLGARYGWW